MYQTVSCRRVVSGLWLGVWLCLGCRPSAPDTSLPYYNTPDFTPVFVASTEEVSQKVSHRIADFSFTNQNGQIVTQQAVAGKIHVANFFFTSCGSICPMLMNNLKPVTYAFENQPDVVFLSYTVTPWIDSTARLHTYAQRHHIVSPQWHLLTGNKAQLYTLARQSYFAEEDLGFTKDSSEFLHTEHVLLIDKTLRIRGIYNGTLPLEMQQLKEDIETLQK